MHKRVITLFVFAASVFVSLAAPATRADSVLVAAPNILGSPLNPAIYPEPFTAAQFSLSGLEFVTTIDFNFVGQSQTGIPVTLSLVSALTGSATTFGTFNFTTTNTLTNTFTATLDQNLAAGTYFLVVASKVPIGDFIAGWEDSDGTLIQNAGTVANGEWTSGDGTTWTFVDNTNPSCQAEGSICFPGVFDVNGSPATVTPEPGTLALLGTGLLITAWRRRRACR